MYKIKSQFSSLETKSCTRITSIKLQWLQKSNNAEFHSEDQQASGTPVSDYKHPT